MSNLYLSLYEIKGISVDPETHFNHVHLFTSDKHFPIRSLDIDLSLIPTDFLSKYLKPSFPDKVHETPEVRIYQSIIDFSKRRYLFLLKNLNLLCSALSKVDEFPCFTFLELYIPTLTSLKVVRTDEGKEPTRDQMTLVRELIILGWFLGNTNSERAIGFKEENFCEEE